MRGIHHGLIVMMNTEASQDSEEDRKHETVMRATNVNLNNKAKMKLTANTNKWETLYLEQTGKRPLTLSSPEDSPDYCTPIVATCKKMKKNHKKQTATTLTGNLGGVGPPPAPGSHLTTLEWPKALASPGDTSPSQPEE